MKQALLLMPTTILAISLLDFTGDCLQCQSGCSTDWRVVQNGGWCKAGNNCVYDKNAVDSSWCCYVNCDSESDTTSIPKPITSKCGTECSVCVGDTSNDMAVVRGKGVSF